MTRLTRNILGVTLLLAGIAGVLLPIIPGTPFILAAIAVLGAEHPLIRPWIQHLRRWTKMGSSTKV